MWTVAAWVFIATTASARRCSVVGSQLQVRLACSSLRNVSKGSASESVTSRHTTSRVHETCDNSESHHRSCAEGSRDFNIGAVVRSHARGGRPHIDSCSLRVPGCLHPMWCLGRTGVDGCDTAFLRLQGDPGATLFKFVAYEEPLISSLMSRGRTVSSQTHQFVTLHRWSQPMRDFFRQETWRDRST